VNPFRSTFPRAKFPTQTTQIRRKSTRRPQTTRPLHPTDHLNPMHLKTFFTCRERKTIGSSARKRKEGVKMTATTQTYL